MRSKISGGSEFSERQEIEMTIGTLLSPLSTSVPYLLKRSIHGTRSKQSNDYWQFGA